MKVFLYFLAAVAFLLGLAALIEGLTYASSINQSLAASLSPLRELGGGELVDAILGDLTLFIQLAGIIIFLFFSAIGLLLWFIGYLLARITGLSERVARLEANLEGKAG